MKFSAGKEFVLPAEGPTLAVCYLVADLGTQETEYQGKKGFKRQLMMAFELPSQLHTETGKPLIQYTRRFTASLSEQSALRPFLQAWRGQKFSDSEITKFSAKALLGKGAMLQIAHSEKNGKKRSQIMSIMGLPAGTKVAAPVNEALYFSIDDSKDEDFAKLPEWIQKILAASTEFKGRAQPGRYSEPGGATAPVSGGKFDDMGDDIPF